LALPVDPATADRISRPIYHASDIFTKWYKLLTDKEIQLQIILLTCAKRQRVSRFGVWFAMGLDISVSKCSTWNKKSGLTLGPARSRVWAMPRGPLFTRDNAKTMQLRAVAVRRANKLAAIAEKERLEAELEAARVRAQAEIEIAPEEKHVRRVLAGVRASLGDALQAMRNATKSGDWDEAEKVRPVLVALMAQDFDLSGRARPAPFKTRGPLGPSKTSAAPVGHAPTQPVVIAPDQASAV
jgi:hypothetical protein